MVMCIALQAIHEIVKQLHILFGATACHSCPHISDGLPKSPYMYILSTCFEMCAPRVEHTASEVTEVLEVANELIFSGLYLAVPSMQ